MSTILCIDDEPALSVVLEHTLTEIGHRPMLATSVEEALQTVAREDVDLIISDYRMPNATGLDLLDQLRERGHDIPVIIMTGYASIEHAVLSIRHGAIDYLTKPLRMESLRIAVNNAIEMTRLRRENDEFRREIGSIKGSRTIVGQARALSRVMDTIAAVAHTRATVLLEGESGTGKELFARAIHEQSPRAGQPLVMVNCAALPEGLVESTLFGHERGAFTGATARAPGAFERAHRGTLVLDEVSEMRLDLQSKLLRAIQEQEFERVGGNQPVRVDVRVIATTNRDLRGEVEAGRFRSDLYYRLHVVPIHTPALRERVDDIPLLAEHFVKQCSSELGIKAPRLLPESIDFLKRRAWPGNVRELANAVERAVILCRGGKLAPDAFAVERGPLTLVPPPTPAPPVSRRPSGAERQGVALAEAPDSTEEEAPARVANEPGILVQPVLNLRELERIAIDRALAATGGHRTRAAELLGISERTLRNKLNGGTKEAVA
jgi:two-component system, NtrC family, response regulator